MPAAISPIESRPQHVEQISAEYAVGHRDTELAGHQWSRELGNVEYRSAVDEHGDIGKANVFVNVNSGTAQNPIAGSTTFEGLLRRSFDLRRNKPQK
ncbi:hypothetical protein ACFYO1_39315 [Nocardia sp. NPDC006044]|uniref:hypothetical protein n=1 Tax=Nocardia sp. NPDC006044 TaxID=3364306 RepID=UPI0036882D3A